jgi:hypothetical protein
MTTAQIADLIGARPTGRRKWMGRCPFHDDCNPSLSLAEGRGGRTLVRCWAGCELNDILVAAALRVTDLFPGPPPSPEKLLELARERRILEEFDRKRAAEQRAVNEQYRKLYAVCDTLAARLSRMPNGEDADAVGALFHKVLEMLRRIEATFEAEESLRFRDRLRRQEEVKA